jgi:hypothetical protein
MFKKAVFSPAHPARAKTRAFPVGGRSERGTEAYFFRYVEVPSDARTKLADFFNILPEGIREFR